MIGLVSMMRKLVRSLRRCVHDNTEFTYEKVIEPSKANQESGSAANVRRCKVRLTAVFICPRPQDLSHFRHLHFAESCSHKVSNLIDEWSPRGLANSCSVTTFTIRRIAERKLTVTASIEGSPDTLLRAIFYSQFDALVLLMD